MTGFLETLRREHDGGGVLIIDHVATRYALEVVAGGVELEEVIAVPFAWQPGWEYVL